MTPNIESPAFSSAEREGLFTVCLLAAFADGNKSESERNRWQELVEQVPDGELHASAALQNVLLRKTELASVAAMLTTPLSRQRAVEMAICVCEADDVMSPTEERFLKDLCAALGLSFESFAALRTEAEAATQSTFTGQVPPVLTDQRDEQADRMILNCSILNGALELMPQSLATMAIIPLQTRMVYRIGRIYGHELSRAHIKDFLATVGVGMASQLVEGYARKLVGGLFGGVAKGWGKAIAGQATSSAFSFATTYALGQLARRYYAGGRRLGTAELKDAFSSLTGEGRSLQSTYAQEIRDKARNLNISELLPLIKGA